jgi:hypothetical protein
MRESGFLKGAGASQSRSPPQYSLIPRDIAVQEPGGTSGADADTVRANAVHATRPVRIDVGVPLPKRG